jgi:hypothetical protein
VVERRRLVQHVEEGGITRNGTKWLARTIADAFAFVEQNGEAFATEISAAVPAMASTLTFGEGKAWGATQRVATRVLNLMGAEGMLVRGRPRGSWTSNQYRWAPMSAWIGDRAHSVSTADAQVELARRYVRSFGPVTVADVKWWTGWTLGATRKALAAIETVDVETDAGPALLLAEDEAPVAVPEPWAALLPGLDPTAMGWTARDWYLGPHRSALFDRAGNIGPTVWVDGRIVGAWAQRKDGTIVHRLLEDVDRASRRRIDVEVERMTTLLGDVRVTPRMRTPAERALVVDA